MKNEPSKVSPLMQQWQEAKERHPGMLLMFLEKDSDCYKLFGEDAVAASQLLGLALAKRGGAIITGFPHQYLESYLRKLLQAGQRVAICEE